MPCGPAHLDALRAPAYTFEGHLPFGFPRACLDPFGPALGASAVGLGRAFCELCVITRNVPRLGRSHLGVAQSALLGGARFVQFREKDMTTREALAVAHTLRQLTRDFGALFVINDRVDLALAVGADGVHVGEQDMPVSRARRLLGPKALIGASAATVEAALAAQAASANYLGVGPIYATSSKADAGDALGLGPLREVASAVQIPILAIGGITAENTPEVIRAGAAGVAVISAITDAEDSLRATESLLHAVQQMHVRA